jgi:signal transduction histidine kinase
MFNKTWHFLTDPHKSITDIEEMRQSRLLSALTLALILTTTLASVSIIRREGEISQSLVGAGVGILVTVFNYLLNRAGKYKASAWLFVGFNFLLVFSMPLLTGDLFWLWFTNLTILLAAMLLPRWSPWIFAAGYFVHIFQLNFHPIEATYTNFTTIVVYSVLSPLILVFMYHRTQLEKERQAELRAANEALRRSEAELEKRVAARTRDLRVASEVARQITSLLDPEYLLPQLVERTREAFDLYFVSVFLYQPGARRLLLAAGSGEAGTKMLADGKAYDLDERPSLVALAGRERRPVIIGDTAREEFWARNPYLPDTKSEVQLPMIVGDELIGVLGLQARQGERFNDENMVVFATLAEQIGVAVKNSQLFQEQAQLAAELKEADKVKTQFLANMSHELRTPLNAIINNAEMVASGMMGDIGEEQVQLLNQSILSSNHLLNLINDVLDISKIQAGKLSLLIEPDVSLNEEIAAITGMLAPQLRDSGVDFIQQVAPNLPRLQADRRRIRQIVLNLLTNAIKFTPSGMITLSAFAGDGEVVISVADTGVGIAPDMQEMIFQPFIQTRDGAKQAEGTGLGLPIVKELVQAHHGTLRLESEPGRGSTFTITLPAA